MVSSSFSQGPAHIVGQLSISPVVAHLSISFPCISIYLAAAVVAALSPLIPPPLPPVPPPPPVPSPPSSSTPPLVPAAPSMTRGSIIYLLFVPPLSLGYVIVGCGVAKTHRECMVVVTLTA